MAGTQVFALTGATLIDGTGVAPVNDATVVVDSSSIVAAGPAATTPIPTGATIYDVAGQTVMPGLIDGHVHLRSYAVPGRYQPRLWQVTTFIEEQTLHAAGNAWLALQSGVTTVRDMAGGRPEVAVKHAIDDGVLWGARVIASGFVGMTAGHGDLFCPAGVDQRFWPPADGVDEIRKLIRRYARDGLDLIKICTSGGVLSTGDKNEWRNYTLEETLAVVDEAHALGMRVAVHAHTKAGIRQAIEAGVDTIEHGTSLDDELVGLMLENRIRLCPTLAVTNEIMERGRERGLAEESLEKAARLFPLRDESIRKAYRAGVPIFMGTDSSQAYNFGQHARELELLHTVIGMTPMETVSAATRTAAEALGIESEIGTIESGKVADLLVVNGDPLENLAVLQDPGGIIAVFKEGALEVDRGLKSAILADV